MPDYGWAYINLDALSTISGPTGSLTFRNGSQALSGTSAFIYATASHKIGIGVNVPGALTRPLFALQAIYRSAEMLMFLALLQWKACMPRL